MRPKFDATAFRKTAATRGKKEEAQRGAKLTTGMTYRFTEAKRQQMEALADALTRKTGRKVSFVKVLDAGLDALQEKLETEAKAKAS